MTFEAAKNTMVKYTQAYLKKLEDLLKEGAYEVRYEKGNFKSGYCVLEEKRVVVINKFSTLESRIQALVEIIQTMAKSGLLQSDLRKAGLKNPIIQEDGSVDGEIEFTEDENSEITASGSEEEPENKE